MTQHDPSGGGSISFRFFCPIGRAFRIKMHFHCCVLPQSDLSVVLLKGLSDYPTSRTLRVAAYWDRTRTDERRSRWSSPRSKSKGWPCPAAWRSTAKRWTPSGTEGFDDVESSIYDYYFEMLSGLAANRTERGKNVVITLNYDLLVEEAARRLNVPVTCELGSTGVAIEPDAEVRDVGHVSDTEDLHGSMNWAREGRRFDPCVSGLRTRAVARTGAAAPATHLE